MKRTQIYLDEEQDQRLARRARAAGVTKSAMIRAAIEAWLTRGTPPSEKEDALEETFGAMKGIRAPDRDEWDRGYG